MRGIILMMIFLGVESYNVTHQTQLNADLLTGYDRRVRPDNGNTPTNISVSFHATSLKEFSESEGKIALVGAFRFHWTDDRFVWNAASYGNDLHKTVFYVKDVWVPRLVNMNPYDSIRMLG